MATTQPGGGMSGGDILGLLTRNDQAIVTCDMKRQLLIDAWPKQAAPITVTPPKK